MVVPATTQYVKFDIEFILKLLRGTSAFTIATGTLPSDAQYIPGTLYLDTTVNPPEIVFGVNSSTYSVGGAAGFIVPSTTTVIGSDPSS